MQGSVGAMENRGTIVLGIEAIPVKLTQPVLMQTVTACAAGGVTLTLLAMSDGRKNAQAGKLHVYLVMQVEQDNFGIGNARLRDVAAAVNAQLQTAGFQIKEVLEKDARTMGELQTALNWEECDICFGGEDVGSMQGFYVPSNHAEFAPLDLSEIAVVLARNPGCAFAIQLARTVLYREEVELLTASKKWFDAQNQKNAEGAKGKAERFEQILKQQGKPLFFLSMLFCGTARARQELSALMLRQRLTLKTLPFGCINREDWLFASMPAVAKYVAAEGHVLAQRMFLAPAMKRLNHIITPEEALRFIRVPQELSRIQGLTVQRAAPDLEPIADALTQPENIHIGSRVENGVAVGLPGKHLTRHGVIVGVPGTGKTNFALGLLYNFWKAGIPFLAVEPTKCEYRSLLNAIPELRVYTPGKSGVSPMELNPFLPPRGVTLEQFLPSLITAFTAAFHMTRPLDIIFPEALRTCYTQHGWRSNSTRDSEGVTCFGMQEFLICFRQTIRNSAYDQESKSNLESGGVFRLMSLIESNPMLYDTQNTLPFEELLTVPTVIELDAIDNSDQKALIMALILVNLMLTIRRNQPGDGELKNVILIDEAHILLGRKASVRTDGDADPSGMTVQMLQDMVVAIRAYGTAMIFADQSPEKLTKEIVGNVNMKIMFRLSSAHDRELLAENIGMHPEVMDIMRTLPVGQAYMHCDALQRPIRLQVPDYGKLLNLAPMNDDETAQRLRMNRKLKRPFADCGKCRRCEEGCDAACRMEADFIARSAWAKVEPLLADKESAAVFMRDKMHTMVRLMVSELSPNFAEQKRLIACARMQLTRRVLMNSPGGITRADLKSEGEDA